MHVLAKTGFCSLSTMWILFFKNQDSIENTFHEALVLNPEILDALENLTNIPYVVELPDYNFDEIVRLLKREKIRGIAGLHQ